MNSVLARSVPLAYANGLVFIPPSGPRGLPLCLGEQEVTETRPFTKEVAKQLNFFLIPHIIELELPFSHIMVISLYR